MSLSNAEGSSFFFYSITFLLSCKYYVEVVWEQKEPNKGGWTETTQRDKKKRKKKILITVFFFWFEGFFLCLCPELFSEKKKKETKSSGKFVEDTANRNDKNGFRLEIGFFVEKSFFFLHSPFGFQFFRHLFFPPSNIFGAYFFLLASLREIYWPETATWSFR